MSLYNETGLDKMDKLHILSDAEQILLGTLENLTLDFNTTHLRTISFPDSVSNENVAYESYVIEADSRTVNNALEQAATLFLKLDGTNEMTGNIHFENSGFSTSLGSGILESNVSFILPPNQDAVFEPNNIYLSLDNESDGVTRWKSIPTASTSGSKGLTILSSNITSDSEEFAATSLAVKQAFDMGASAYDLASSAQNYVEGDIFQNIRINWSPELPYNIYTTGINNTSLGAGSMPFNEGTNNTSVGVLSLHSNSTGENNTCLGYQTMMYNVVGYECTAIGTNSQYYGESAVGCVSVGVGSLFHNIS